MLLDPLKPIDEFERVTEQTAFACPECGGPLREMKSEELPDHYRCHTGHMLAPQTLLEEQRDGVEEALWAALRTLKERSQLLRSLADDGAGDGSNAYYERRAAELDDQIASLQSLLVERA